MRALGVQTPCTDNLHAPTSHVFPKPTADLLATALGELGADLHLQATLINNENWFLIRPREVNLCEFGVKFQRRARTQDEFVFRLA
jgi:hypothetical protein